MTDAERLAKIEARAIAATPGPWVDFPVGGPWTRPGVIGASNESEPAYPRICYPSEAGNNDDMVFIAHAREDVPRLLSHIAALEAQVALDGAARRVADAVLERIAADEAFTAYEAHYWASETIGELAGCEARYEGFNGRTERATANEKAAIDAYVTALAASGKGE